MSEELVPLNSVLFTRNVNYDTVVGKAVVRTGTTLLGSAVAAGNAPLGLTEAIGKGGTNNYLFAVFKGASNATAYYYNGTSWAATNKTALSNSKLNRFAVLGGSTFMTNATDGMFDAADHTFGTTNSITTVLPSLIHRYNSTMLCSGDATYPSRVWFSSVISPVTSPFITWSNDATTGNWIDINPDDGGYNTAFAETSTFLLVFKNNAMYRLDTVSKSTQAQNIFNVGAVSQEAVTTCQGLAYFFSGAGIYSTDGSFPQRQGRGQVQDIIDAIPQANWGKVAAGADEFNVYYSVGTVTLRPNTDNATTLTNCVLKFSVRDQSWSVHTYANLFSFFAAYTDTNGRVLRGADSVGDVQTLNLGTSDNTAAIDFEMETQDIEFADRSHLVQIADKIAVFAQNGEGSQLLCKCDGAPKQIPINIEGRITVGKDINLQGHYFRFRWFGTSTGTPAMFEGFTIENITDIGMQQ